MGLIKRFKNGYNAFMNKDPTQYIYDGGYSYSNKPDRTYLRSLNISSIILPIYNRIALDVASLDFRHVKTDENGRFKEIYKSGLDKCLSLEANKDQTGRAFIQDVVMSLLDEGCIAIPIISATNNPNFSESYDIEKLRVGKILKWSPNMVEVNVFNEDKNLYENIEFNKHCTAILENPFYSVMNESRSTMRRLIKKLNQLDAIDEQSSSGKLDIIVQVPYTIKNERLKERADIRRKDLEEQLAGSKYGVAYADASEKITQLNRPVENNMMNQIEYLTNLLYSQLNITQSIMDGTADEKTMCNYYSRTIEPIAECIIDEFIRKFLSTTARSQGQTIMYFRNPFKLVPVSMISEMADKFTRNEILTSNEIRQIIGIKPSDDPKADELRNKNLSEPKNNSGSDKMSSDNIKLEKGKDDNNG